VLQQSFQSAQFQCVGANANNGRSDCNMTRAAATLGNFATLTAIRSSSWTRPERTKAAHPEIGQQNKLI